MSPRLRNQWDEVEQGLLAGFPLKDEVKMFSNFWIGWRQDWLRRNQVGIVVFLKKLNKYSPPTYFQGASYKRRHLQVLQEKLGGGGRKVSLLSPQARREKKFTLMGG